MDKPTFTLREILSRRIIWKIQPPADTFPDAEQILARPPALTINTPDETLAPPLHWPVHVHKGHLTGTIELVP